MIIPVLEGDIVLAKKLSNTLDSTKTYNKFECSNNYIGALGEIILNRYLNTYCHNYTWLGYKSTKGGFDNPDFIIDGKSIDLKTTYSDCLWFQQPKHDIYIYAQLTTDNAFLLISGYIKKEHMLKYATIINRGNRQDYIIEGNKLNSIRRLI